MKNLRTAILCVSITLFHLCAAAQNQFPLNEPDHNKPRLFQQYPDQVIVNIDQLNSLLATPVGTTVRANLSSEGQFVFEGEVVSSVTKYEKTIESVVVRSTNFTGARLSFSRITNADKTQTYTGRIISLQHGDLFELKYQAGQFILVKRKLHELVNE